MLRRLTRAGAIWSFTLGMSKTIWVNSRIPRRKLTGWKKKFSLLEGPNILKPNNSPTWTIALSKP